MAPLFLFLRTVDTRTERSLLRLAIAKGLLCWEDLDAVAERLPETGGGKDGWLGALVAAGRLREEDVETLVAESDATLAPELEPAPSGPPPSGSSDLPLDFRFLAAWDRYRVERLLGSGGMGTVFLAFDPALSRRAALKFLHRNDASQTERFLREARSQARVDHPNVCRVYEVGEVDGRPYIAMQYLEGESLGSLRGTLSFEASAALVRQVAQAIHAAHRTGLIHRDLKPGNIVMGTDGAGAAQPFVLDFGLAREQDEEGLTLTGMVTGTPAYLSPEQAQGQPLDRRTDVYSLGVVLYELLAGAPPFADANVARTLVRIVQEDPPPPRRLAPSIPPDLETIALKCLEKDPARRYASAQALADDLGRFLDGEPIAARPASWAYRAGKRIRKNKLAAGVTVAALAALLALGAVSLRTHLQSREKSELAQRFGQRIQRLEASLRYEAWEPVHDVTPSKRELRREIDAILAEMERLGPVAEGPGHAALGHAYLALREVETAREHLERSWNAGQRTPEVAAALGRALGFEYLKARADASRFQAGPQNAEEAAREEIDRTYRLPAVAYLRESGASTGASPYLAALLAFYEGRYEQALSRAREAATRDPWFHEAGQLEAEVHAARGDDASDRGESEEAARHFERAGELYARLLARVPSDPALHIGECSRVSRQVGVEVSVGEPSEARFAQALAACDLALDVDPELSEPHWLKARLFIRRAERRSRRGEDSRDDLAAAVELAEQAIARNPKDASAQNLLANSLWRLAKVEMSRGADPEPPLTRALETAGRAVELQPDLAIPHNTLGSVELVLALHQLRRGGDPRPTLTRAAESLRRATELNPSYLPAAANLGTAWKMMAELEVARGQDPSTSVGRSVAALEKAIRLNSGSSALFNNRGNAHLTLGDYLLARGADPAEALGRAAADFEKAIELDPDYFLGHYNLGFTRRSLSESRLRRGQDPTPSLSEADRALGEALRLSPDDADTRVEKARVDLVEAGWRRSRGLDPEPALRQALAELERAEAMDPEQPEIHLTWALAQRLRSQEAIERNLRPEAAVQAGLARAERALSINPGEARALAVRGALLALAARLELDPHRRREAERKSEASLREAFRLNPLLEEDLGPPKP